MIVCANSGKLKKVKLKQQSKNMSKNWLEYDQKTMTTMNLTD